MKGFIQRGNYEGGAFAQITRTFDNFIFYNNLFDFLLKLNFKKGLKIYNEIGWQLFIISFSHIFNKKIFYRISNNGIMNHLFMKPYNSLIYNSAKFLIKYGNLSVQNSYQFKLARKIRKRTFIVMHHNFYQGSFLTPKISTKSVAIGWISRKKNFSKNIDYIIGGIHDKNYAEELKKKGVKLLGHMSNSDLINYLKKNKVIIKSNSIYEGYPNIIVDALRSNSFIEFNYKVNLTDLYFRIPNVILNKSNTRTIDQEKYTNSVTTSKINWWYRKASKSCS